MKKFILLFVVLASFSLANAQKVVGIGLYNNPNLYNLNGLNLTINPSNSQVSLPLVIIFINDGSTLNAGDSMYCVSTLNSDTLYTFTVSINNTLNNGDTSFISLTFPILTTKLDEGSNTLCFKLYKTYRSGSYVDLTGEECCATFNIAYSNGISEYLTSEVSIYPNPAKNIIHIENANNSNIEVYNMLGQKVKTVPHIMNNTSIDVSDLNNGMYIVKIQNGNSVQTKKIQISK